MPSTSPSTADSPQHVRNPQQPELHRSFDSPTPRPTPTSSARPVRRTRARPATFALRSRGAASSGGNDATTTPMPRSAASASRPWPRSRTGASCASGSTSGQSARCALWPTCATAGPAIGHVRCVVPAGAAPSGAISSRGVADSSPEGISHSDMWQILSIADLAARTDSDVSNMPWKPAVEVCGRNDLGGTGWTSRRSRGLGLPRWSPRWPRAHGIR